MLARHFKDFLEQDYAIGVLLFVAATLAMITANMPWAGYNDLFLSMPVRISVGALDIHKPLLLWINDGLMAVFFLLIGLEVKQEVMVGELRTPAQVALPGIGAIGGMVVPALLYAAFNYDDPIARQGWAIPAATDIAFAVGILAVLGKRVPASMTTFLLALAIIDDLGAIIIIALFYTDGLSIGALGVGSIFLAILIIMNLFGVTRLRPYLFFGTLMWVCVLKSGVHATLAGVILAFTIPLDAVDRRGRSPLKALQHRLHNKVNFIILPLFAFANAGLDLNLEQVKNLLDPIPFGIVVGLFVGKQVGVFSCCWLAIKLGIAKLPNGSNWLQMYGLSILCGIGFTMSLFISSLAFEGVDPSYMVSDRIGILTGSIISAAMGFAILFYAGRHQPHH